jgi:chromosome segregation ATPase
MSAGDNHGPFHPERMSWRPSAYTEPLFEYARLLKAAEALAAGRLEQLAGADAARRELIAKLEAAEAERDELNETCVALRAGKATAEVERDELRAKLEDANRHIEELARESDAMRGRHEVAEAKLARIREAYDAPYVTSKVTDSFRAAIEAARAK